MQQHVDKHGNIFEGLEINFYNDPWPHLECKSPRLVQFCEESYNYYSQFPSSSNVANGDIQSNTGFVGDDTRVLPSSILDGYNHMDTLCYYLVEKYFADNVVSNGKWSVHMCESTMVNNKERPELESGILFPHTDNPIEIIEENRKNQLDESIYKPGVVKLVMYTGDDNLNYDDYGKKLYTKKTEIFHDTGGYSGFNLSKEVKYVNGSLFMWAPGPDTWHGTDFCSHLDNRRIFYTGEYYE